MKARADLHNHTSDTSATCSSLNIVLGYISIKLEVVNTHIQYKLKAEYKLQFIRLEMSTIPTNLCRVQGL